MTVFAVAVEAVEGAVALDAPAKPLGKFVRGTLARQPLKDTLSGTWLGHAVHPVLTDVVTGAFLSSTMLDLLGGDDGERARRRLVSVGIVAAAPTLGTGANNWGDGGPGGEGGTGVRGVGGGGGAPAGGEGSEGWGGRGAGR